MGCRYQEGWVRYHTVDPWTGERRFVQHFLSRSNLHRLLQEGIEFAVVLVCQPAFFRGIWILKWQKVCDNVFICI